MNILTDKLPDCVEIDGIKYSVFTDFRIWMEFDRIMHRVELSTKDKFMMIFRLCLDIRRCKILPEDMMASMEALKRFYLCGKEIKETGAKKCERALDYDYDSGYLYSAFLTQYGIDLLSVPYMHWYVFCALLEGLEEGREIIKIMRFRLARPEEEQNAEKRKYLKRMKEFYALNDSGTEKNKEEEIAEIIFKAF